MNQKASIVEQAEKLPPVERIRLVEHLLHTLDKPDPEIDAIWAEESEQRLDAYLRDKTTALNAADVIAKHLKT